jgi:CRP-like cAMP-binding protein
VLTATTYKNLLLRNLGAETLERLRLRPVTFELQHEIEYPGNQIKSVFFVEEGMAAMTAAFEDGSQVEVGMFGHESVIGASVFIGTRRSYKRVYTQIAGSGYSSPVEAALKEFYRGGIFQERVLRYIYSQLVQAAQSAACNAKHNVEQRLARWLLLCADRICSYTYTMSQDSLADMLGSTRPTISIAAGILKEKKLIAYSRGVIRILDVQGLEKMACECYRIVKNHLHEFTESQSGVSAPPM